MGIAVTQDSMRVSISSKRQITIPQKFFSKLGFGTEAEILLKDDAIIVRPARKEDSGEFAEQILTELLNEGYSGDNLLKEFKKRQAQVRPAVVKMLEDADAVANGNADFMTYDDVFGEK